MGIMREGPQQNIGTTPAVSMPQIVYASATFLESSTLIEPTKVPDTRIVCPHAKQAPSNSLSLSPSPMP